MVEQALPAVGHGKGQRCVERARRSTRATSLVVVVVAAVVVSWCH